MPGGGDGVTGGAEARRSRRVQYTLGALRGALLRLLDEHPDTPVERVTVKALCEAADVNRSTFYAHYGQPLDLLKDMEHGLMRDLTDYLAGFSLSGDALAARETVVRVCEYIARNAALCRVLLRAGSGSLDKQLQAICRGLLFKGMIPREGLEDGTADYLSEYTVRGAVSVVRLWLETGLKEPPAQIASVLSRAGQGGILAFFQVVHQAHPETRHPI